MSSLRLSTFMTHAIELTPDWLLRSLRKLRKRSSKPIKRPVEKSAAEWQIPTVDDWYDLSRQYPEFQRVSNTALKDFGYMKVFAYLDADESRNKILEFGHGFNPVLFARYCHTRNLWGLDRCGAAYFTQQNDEWEVLFKETMGEDVLSNATFKRGLLGSPDKCDLPEGFFDVVCSVSVLEEVPIGKLPGLIHHAARLLKPGGVFIGTHDIQAHQGTRVAYLRGALKKAGLIVGSLPVSISPSTWISCSPS